MLIDRLKSG